MCRIVQNSQLVEQYDSEWNDKWLYRFLICKTNLTGENQESASKLIESYSTNPGYYLGRGLWYQGHIESP